MKYINPIIFTFILLMATAGEAFGQGTSFTYQGKLETNGTPANGPYLFQFKVLDANNAQIGPTITDLSANVVNGIFTVQLDFGDTPFNGDLRFLQIGVRDTVTVPYVLLTPNQQLTSAPYAIRSSVAAQADNAANATNALTAQNALKLGGIAANQYVLTGDSRLSDARTPTTGSNNYIQNSLATQFGASFSISGNGSALGTMFGGTVNTGSHYAIGGSKVLSTPGTGNLFVGVNAGLANTVGFQNTFLGIGAGKSNTAASDNTFVGFNAGALNTTGELNTFVGVAAGQANQTGEKNTFVGTGSGAANTAGSFNSFFGRDSGEANSTGSNNLFFGVNAGQHNTTANNNSFFGTNAGLNNTTGTGNTFVGNSSGQANTIGNNNTAIGNGSDVTANSFGTAIGAGAVANNNNTIVLGRANGQDRVVIYGVGVADLSDVPLCLRASDHQIAVCNVNLNIAGQTSIAPLGNGPDTVTRLQEQIDEQNRLITLLESRLERLEKATVTPK